MANTQFKHPGSMVNIDHDHYKPIAADKKWTKGIDAASLSELAEAADKITKLHHETVNFVARKQIEVGQILLAAREKFPGDKEFGQWRETCTPIGSRQTAHKLMQLATQAGAGRITEKLLDGLPTSTLFELLSAPDSVVNAIEEKVEAGEKPSQKEVREIRAEAAAPSTGQRGPTHQTDKPQVYTNHAKPKAEPESPEAKYNKILEKAFEFRVDAFRDSGEKLTDEWSWVIFGIPPFAEGLPHKEVVGVMHLHYLKDCFSDSIKATLNDAMARLMKLY